METQDMTRRLLIIASVVALGGFNRPTPAQPDHELVALTDTQIAAALGGMTINKRDEDLIVSGVDTFCRDGTFWLGRDRVGPLRGTYRIDSGRLCLEVAEATQCKYAFRDAAGAVYLSNNQDGRLAWPVSFAAQSPMDCSQRFAG
jgi:hypothetical protein